MNPKHLLIRIDQCRVLATASNCVRAQYGAVLIDPSRNVVLMDGYNGAPRGGGRLCGGLWCHRAGLDVQDIKPFQVKSSEWWLIYQPPHLMEVDLEEAKLRGPFKTKSAAVLEIPDLLQSYPRRAHGSVEVGCHHAEMNVICNAAANGTSCNGAWLLVTGEPCLMCAKLIHHAGISKVIMITPSNGDVEGINYMIYHGVEVQHLTHEEVNAMARALREENRKKSSL